MKLKMVFLADRDWLSVPDALWLSFPDANTNEDLFQRFMQQQDQFPSQIAERLTDIIAVLILDNASIVSIHKVNNK